MFSKTLLTVLFIIAAFFLVRQRRLGDANANKTHAGTSAIKRIAGANSEFSSDLRFAAYMTVILLVGLGGTLYYFRWQQDHEVLTITLHRDTAAAPISYQVFRYQLQDRSFITLDGTSVTVAASERMEVIGLDQ